jgi:hypothetical protein
MSTAMTNDTRLRERGRFPTDGCPSDFEIDRWHLAELDAGPLERLEAHLAACAPCAARAAIARAGFAALEVDGDRLYGSLAEKMHDRRLGLWARLRRWAALPQIMIPVAAAASIAVFSVTGEDVVRSKGGLALGVFRERGGAVEEVANGSTLKRGDRIRFKIRVPEISDASRIMVVGVEASGKVFAYYPSDGSDRSATPRVKADGALEGAIELDDYRGEEVLYLIHCRRDFALRDVSLSGKELRPPDACERASFSMVRTE